MNQKLMQLTMISALCLPMATAHSQTLLDAFKNALENDSNYRAALANQQAGEAERKIGRAGLLPQVSASILQGRASTDRRALNSPTPFTDSSETDLKNNVLSLQQPIVNPAAWARYDQSKLIAKQTEIEVFEARNNLATQVTSAYLDILGAIDQLTLARDETRAFEERFKLVQSGLKNGEFAETDVLQAQAQFDVAYARELEAREILNLQLSGLENLTGVKSKSVYAIDKFQLGNLPKLENFSTLKQRALRSNPTILAGILEVRVAQAEVEKQSGAHYPNIDLVVRRVDSESDSVATLGQAFEQTTYAVQMQVPIFQGFGVSASVDKATAGVDRAQALWDQRVRETLFNFQEQYSRYAVAQTKLDAFERAVKSGEAALKAVELGTKFGLNTLSEVLEAQRTLNTARRDYSRVLYESLSAWVQLRGLTGKLNLADLQQLSNLISSQGQKIDFERPEVPVPELLDPSLFELTPFEEGEATGGIIQEPLVKPALAKEMDLEGNTTYRLVTQEPEPLKRAAK